MTSTVIFGLALVGVLLLGALVAWWRAGYQQSVGIEDAQAAYQEGRWVAAVNHLSALLGESAEQPLGPETAASTLEALGVFERMVLELGFDRPEWLFTLRHRLERLVETGKPTDTGLLERLSVFLGKADSMNRGMLMETDNGLVEDEANIVQQNLEKVFGYPRLIVREEHGDFPASVVDLTPTRGSRLRARSASV